MPTLKIEITTPFLPHAKHAHRSVLKEQLNRVMQQLGSTLDDGGVLKHRDTVWDPQEKIIGSWKIE